MRLLHYCCYGLVLSTVLTKLVARVHHFGAKIVLWIHAPEGLGQSMAIWVLFNQNVHKSAIFTDVREYLAEYALHLQNNTVEKFIGPKFGVFGTEMRNYCREGHYFQLFDMLDASDGLLALARA